MAGLLALSVVGAGVIWNTRAAAGADAYGYVSQADLWLRGNLFIDQSFGANVPWPLARWTFTPLGYRPEPVGHRIVPSYSPGLPMLMAAAKAIAGACAMFWIVPLAGGVLVFATYGIGRRIGRPWVGVGAAWLVATSPAMLFMLMAPMSDVPAAAAWAVAVMFALPPSLGPEDTDLRRSGGEASLAAAASGLSAAIAILIRPNLVPLAAIIGLWIFWRDSLRPLRSVLFAATASAGAIGVAMINARLYGSPLASGYGDLSDAYSWSNVVTNLERYGGWLVSAETPVMLAGLACLFVPVSALWPTRESRRTLRLFAGVAAAVWASYLLYVPWDAWWYLRFLLPAWPMMAIGAASLAAVVIKNALQNQRRPLVAQAFRPAKGRWAALKGCATSNFATHSKKADISEFSMVLRVVVVAVIVAVGAFNVRRAVRLNVFDQASAEAKYLETAQVVEAITAPDAVIVSGLFSGSVRYYAGRLTLRWDWLDPEWLDRAVEWLTARGHHVYILLEAPEVDPFRARFGRTNAIGRLDWVPVVTFRGRSIQLHDAEHRDRFERPVEQPPLRAIRECLPQKPPPRLRMP